MKELETTFLGRGEVRGFKFRQVARTDAGYLFEVRQPNVDKPHFEVFYRRVHQRFGVVRYPRAEMFGKWAFAYTKLDEALDKLSEISGMKIMPQNCQNCSSFGSKQQYKHF